MQLSLSFSSNYTGYDYVFMIFDWLDPDLNESEL
jgi:hypothetical protein